MRLSVLLPDDRRVEGGKGGGGGGGVKRVGTQAVKRAGGLAGAVKPTNNSLLLAFDDCFIWETTHIIRSLTISVRDMIAPASHTLQRRVDIKRGERGEHCAANNMSTSQLPSHSCNLLKKYLLEILFQGCVQAVLNKQTKRHLKKERNKQTNCCKLIFVVCKEFFVSGPV